MLSNEMLPWANNEYHVLYNCLLYPCHHWHLSAYPLIWRLQNDSLVSKWHQSGIKTQTPNEWLWNHTSDHLMSFLLSPSMGRREAEQEASGDFSRCRRRRLINCCQVREAPLLFSGYPLFEHQAFFTRELSRWYRLLLNRLGGISGRVV